MFNNKIQLLVGSLGRYDDLMNNSNDPYEVAFDNLDLPKNNEGSMPNNIAKIVPICV